MQTSALPILLAISIAVFGLFGKYALDMRRDHNYRASWGWALWAILPGFLPALYFASQGMPVNIRNITLGAIGAVAGACAAIWIGYMIAGSQVAATTTVGDIKSPSPHASTPMQQNNQGPGQQFKAPGGNIYVNPSPQPPPDSGTIQQAGVVVGNAFGARRSPTDATLFEFTEITNCGRFNLGTPFIYKGVKMQFVREKNSAMLEISRQQDSPIRYGVVAKVLE